jgi:hypothetical protein
MIRVVYLPEKGLYQEQPGSGIDFSAGELKTGALVTNIRLTQTSTDIQTIDSTILCDASNTEIIVSLSSLSNGRMLCIKKIDNSGNHVKVRAQIGYTIDGQQEQIITAQYVSMTIQILNNNWYII